MSEARELLIDWSRALSADLYRRADLIENEAAGHPGQTIENRATARSLRQVSAAIDAAGTATLGALLKPEPAPPAEHWSDLIRHDGNERPLPPKTHTEVRYLEGGIHSGPARAHDWARIGWFRYRCDTDGFFRRPADWIPPESAYPLEWQAGRVMARLDRPHGAEYLWKSVTHIRLLPRPEKCEPLPQWVSPDENNPEWFWIDGQRATRKELERASRLAEAYQLIKAREAQP